MEFNLHSARYLFGMKIEISSFRNFFSIELDEQIIVDLERENQSLDNSIF
jgi:hypothetical protein